MKRMTLSALAGIGLMTLAPVLSAQAQTTLTADEAHAIGVDAYVYFYPLLSMEISRQTFTNITHIRRHYGYVAGQRLFNYCRRSFV